LRAGLTGRIGFELGILLPFIMGGITPVEALFFALLPEAGLGKRNGRRIWSLPCFVSRWGYHLR
jgi:hypothetical protein